MEVVSTHACITPYTNTSPTEPRIFAQATFLEQKNILKQIFSVS